MGCDKENDGRRKSGMEFLLTHPVWDVTRKMNSVLQTKKISTHTSRVGCDATPAARYNVTYLFLLTHPVWDVTLFRPLNGNIGKFLLTHPVWDVTAIYSIFQSHYSHILQDGPIIHLELY